MDQLFFVLGYSKSGQVFSIASGISMCTGMSNSVVTYFPDTPCSNGDIRLVDGLISTEGSVEVCMDGGWTGICDSSWNYQDAFVVCLQLGYPATGMSHCTSICTT